MDAERHAWEVQYAHESAALKALRASEGLPEMGTDRLAELQSMFIAAAESTDRGIQMELLTLVRKCQLPVALQRWIAVTDFAFGGQKDKFHLALQVVKNASDARMDSTLNFLDRMVEYGMLPSAVRFRNSDGFDAGGLLDAVVSAPSGDHVSTGGPKLRFPELLVRLIDMGCDPTRVSEAGTTPAGRATKRGVDDRSCVLQAAAARVEAQRAIESLAETSSLYHGTGVYALAAILEDDALVEGVHWGKPGEPHGPRLTEHYPVAVNFILNGMHWGEGGVLVLDRERLMADWTVVQYEDQAADGKPWNTDEGEHVVVAPRVGPLSKYIKSIVIDPEVIKVALDAETMEDAIQECGWAFGADDDAARAGAARALLALKAHPKLNAWLPEGAEVPWHGNWERPGMPGQKP